MFFFTSVTLVRCEEDGSFQLGFHALYTGVSLAFLKSQDRQKEDVGGNISDEGGEISPQQTPRLSEVHGIRRGSSKRIN